MLTAARMAARAVRIGNAVGKRGPGFCLLKQKAGWGERAHIKVKQPPELLYMHSTLKGN